MQTGPSSPLCRSDCGACCTAPSISSPIPGMPQGKAAGERCVQLDERQRCRIFGDPRRPAVCSGLQPSAEMCGSTREQAMSFLTRLEQLTAPTLSSLRGTGPASGSGGLPVSSKA